MVTREPYKSYDQSLAYLRGLAVFGIKPGLERMEALLALMGNPERRARFIHVGGTNGKGSTLAIMDALLREMGWRTGCFTSPHIHDWRERVRCDGSMISKEDVLRGVNIIRPLAALLPARGLEHPTEFEISTALAFWYFAEQRPDIVLLEVGLGGAVDSTNVIQAEGVVLTSVGMDHMEYLGGTLTEIAGVKAGIIKDKAPVVMSEQYAEVVPVIEEACRRCGAPLICVRVREGEFKEDVLAEQRVSRGVVYGEAYAAPLPSLTPEYTSCFDYYGVIGGPVNGGSANSEPANGEPANGERTRVNSCEVSLVGRHQIQNAATALAAVEVLLKRDFSSSSPYVTSRPHSACHFSSLSSERVRQALLKVVWPGRTELVMCSLPHKTVRVLLDGAHNEEGMRALAQVLEQGFPRRRLVFCLGMLADKAIEKSLKSLLPLGDAFVTTRVPSERAGNWRRVTDLVKAAGYLCREEENVAAAVRVALEMCGEEDLLCVTGSLYMLGEIDKIFLELCDSFKKWQYWF